MISGFTGERKKAIESGRTRKTGILREGNLFVRKVLDEIKVFALAEIVLQTFREGIPEKRSDANDFTSKIISCFPWIFFYLSQALFYS